MRYLFICLLLVGCSASGPIPLEEHCDELTVECFEEFEQLCVSTGGGFVSKCVGGLGACSEYEYFCDCEKWKDGCKEL